MANPLRLQVQGLPQISENEQSATSSPARGKEMRANLLAKLRAPPLVHAWEFWHDRQDRQTNAPGNASSDQNGNVDHGPMSQQKYEERLVKLTEVTDVRSFWEMFNNFDTTRLPLRDSIHLFHKGVKPVWEDPRNVKGGSWTFRVPKDKARDFWKEVCMLAIGEKLQEAVATKRLTFIDDICGVSLSVRFNSSLLQIWNRDGDHASGIQKIVETVIENLPQDLQPREGSYYYKKHSEHAGFSVPSANAEQKPSVVSESAQSTDHTSIANDAPQHDGVNDAIRGVHKEVENLNRAIQDVDLEGKKMTEKLMEAELVEASNKA